MAASFTTPKHKVGVGQTQDEWTIREKLTLASSVVRSGDQNWVSVSRAIKPVTESGCCAIKRPQEFFSQKNCAIHYSEMLEKVSTPKRKRTNEGGGAETPGEQIVRKLTFERLEELKKSIKNDHMTYRKLKMRIDDIRNGKLDAQLPAVWEEIQARKRKMEELQSQAATMVVSSGGDISSPLLPNTYALSTPMSAPVPPGLKQSPNPSPQKGKQLRIPKPTPRFQKYQQQLQQRHGQGGQHLQLSSHPLDASGMGGSDIPGITYGGDPLKTEPMDIDPGAAVQTVSLGNSPGTTGISMSQRSEPTQQSPSRHTPVRRSSSVSSGQGLPESALVSLLSLPPKDGKGHGEPDISAKKDSDCQQSAGDQSTSLNVYVSPSQDSSHSQQKPPTSQAPGNTQGTDGKPFLGVTSPMETKKLDSIRDRMGNIIPLEAPSVSAPTLSKLLASNSPLNSPAPNASLDKPPPQASLQTYVSETAVLFSPQSMVSSKVSIVVDASVNLGSDHGISGTVRGAISVGGLGEDGGGAVTTFSVNPKAALLSTLPSPMAITPPPTTPPAEKKEIMTESVVQRVEPLATQSDTRSTAETGSTKREPETVLTVTPGTDQLSHGPEIKIEIVDTPQPSPRLTGRARAPKPGRPGRPPRGGRRSQRHRSKSATSATSTDNDTEVEEEHEEDTKSETMEVESEKASEKDDEDMESTISEKKDSDDEDEQESVDDGYSESGDRVKEESFLERMSTVGSESVPASPASHLSQGDDMESVQAQKTWRKSIMLVWRAAANHKYANVFLHPVTDDEAPGYHSVVFRPMDLSTIKKSIENGNIRTTSEFQRDMMLMFQNALMYNSSDHDVYRMAEEMRDDVMDQIQSYIATQLMVQSSERDSKMLRGHRSDVFHFFL